MSVLSHQSYANSDTPYWASASVPTALVSPLSVVDTYGVPTKKTTIEATSGGTGAIFVSNMDGTQFVGIDLQQGATQPFNTISLDVGNVNPVMVVGSSNVVSTMPIVIDSPLNAQNFQILPTPGGVEMQMGTPVGGGSAIAMTNGPAGVVGIMGASTFSQSNIVFADKLGNDTTINEKQVQFGNNAGNVAQVGLTGTSAFLGTFTAPTTTPGVLVNINNGCELQFADATPTLYGMKSTSGVLNIGPPALPTAISINSTGQVNIPDIVSGSFVPIGGIVMFSGLVGSLPANWKVCDGTAGTPDLRDRFILGAGTIPSGSIGGSTTILTGNLPAHNHGVNDPGHAHNVVLSAMFNNGDNGSAIVYAGQSLTGTAGPRQSDPNAAQTAFTGITTQNTGSGTPYFQPYYTLAYIIRVS